MAARYHFLSEFSLTSEREAVWAALTAIRDWPTWWHSLKRVDLERDATSDDGVGGIYRLHVRAPTGANGIHTTESDGVTVSGNTVAGNDEHGIAILWMTGGQVVGNTSRSNVNGGIVLWDSINVLVSGNAASENGTSGIALDNGPTASTVVDNTADRNGQGFEVEDSDGNTLTGNSASGNTCNGFVLWYSSASNVLEENTANENHDQGFVLVGANANELARNTANGNVNFGFVVVEGASNNTMSRNAAHENASLDAVEDGAGTGNVWLRNSFGTTYGLFLAEASARWNIRGLGSSCMPTSCSRC